MLKWALRERGAIRTFRRYFRVSSPGEFRPEPPTDPDVNLSIHPARATLKKAGAFHQDKEFLRLPVDSILT